MKWLLNGKEFVRAYSGNGTTNGWYSEPTTGVTPGPNAPFDEDFHFLINMALGGYFTGNVPASMVTQALEKQSSPRRLEVTYIRVYGSKT